MFNRKKKDDKEISNIERINLEISFLEGEIRFMENKIKQIQIDIREKKEKIYEYHNSLYRNNNTENVPRYLYVIFELDE